MKRKFAFRFCLFLAFMLFGALPIDAQDEAKKDILTGYVKDRTGQPLPGVNVVIKDTELTSAEVAQILDVVTTETQYTASEVKVIQAE